MAQYSRRAQQYLSNGTTNFEVNMLADQDGNIINSFGAASNIPIASGAVTGHSHINKFGYSNNISNLSTIWDGSNIYAYSTSAGAVTVASSSSDDVGAVIEVQGLDGDYNLVVQDITIDGTGATNLIRVFRARLKTPASDETTNIGIISVSIGGDLRAKILAGKGQTLMAVYTIPAGKTGYLLNLTTSVDKATDVTYRLTAREIDDGGFQIKGQFASFGTPLDHNYPIPLVFTEKTDIEIQAEAGNACGGGATFDLILVDNPA
jgi:hypothetical protein